MLAINLANMAQKVPTSGGVSHASSYNPAPKQKSYSESDMGSMAGYDPNLGLGKKGMSKVMYQGKPKSKPILGKVKGKNLT